jgi:hypothetical protein
MDKLTAKRVEYELLKIRIPSITDRYTPWKPEYV